MQPRQKHATKSSSAASTVTLESQSWTRELTRIIDESLFVNIKTTADKAVEAEHVNQQDAQVQIDPDMLPSNAKDQPKVEHRDQMVMTEEVVPTKTLAEVKSEVAVQTEQEVPVKIASTPSIPTTADFSATSTVESETSTGVEQRVVDVLKAWLKTPDFQDIISESITSKLKTSASATSVAKDKSTLNDGGDTGANRVERLLARRAEDKTAVDSAWENLLGVGSKKPVDPPMPTALSRLTPTNLCPPDFDKLQAARQSLFAAGQRALLRPEAVRNPGGPLPFSAADAIQKGPPAPHEAFSISQHLELKKRLESASKSFKKPSDLILEVNFPGLSDVVTSCSIVSIIIYVIIYLTFNMSNLIAGGYKGY